MAGTLLVTDGGLLVTDYKLTQSCFCVSFSQVQFRLRKEQPPLESSSGGRQMAISCLSSSSRLLRSP
jgi:hypothetical protein